MPLTISEREVKQLTIDERVELIGMIWDTIPDSDLPTPEWHRKELERRLDTIASRPDAATPWEQVRDRLRARR